LGYFFGILSIFCLKEENKIDFNQTFNSNNYLKQNLILKDIIYSPLSNKFIVTKEIISNLKNGKSFENYYLRYQKNIKCLLIENIIQDNSLKENYSMQNKLKELILSKVLMENTRYYIN
jgi:hypothetical protein